jgi:2-phosphosulfolactate phosphatase
MRVDLFATAQEIPGTDWLAGRTAVVIDALRATSTITTALHCGARAVVPFLTPEEAKEAARSLPEGRYLLGGERHAVRIPGFHLGNSPLEYGREEVAGREILFTTTNGTRAIQAAAGASALCVASFLNAPAVARKLAESGRDVVICCAGTEGTFSLEDTACGGAVLLELERLGVTLSLNDLGWVALELYRSYRGREAELLARSEHGRRLIGLGLEADLGYCAQVGVINAVPVLRDGRLVI